MSTPSSFTSPLAGSLKREEKVQGKDLVPPSYLEDTKYALEPLNESDDCQFARS